jgi:hypothetical protein
MAGEKITIRSESLEVEIAHPGSAYSGTRFDWSGFITQVTLEDVHTFCVPESYKEGQGTGGIGLCNEFGNDMAVGYEDARPGDLFPKLGIGLLVRDDKPYRFFQPYPLAKHFPIQVDAGTDQVVFIVEPVEARGYAARLTKTVSVAGRTLQIIYHLENAGQKPLVTNEYCHNFVAIDSHLMGPEYSLEFPFQPQFEEVWRMFRPVLPGWMRVLPGSLRDRMLANRFKKMEEIIQVEGMRLKLKGIPKSPFYARLLGFSRTDQPQWRLIHEPSGVGLQESDDFTPVRLAVWGTSHVISAEVFTGINVQPGQAQQWVRRYEFSPSIR